MRSLALNRFEHFATLYDPDGQCDAPPGPTPTDKHCRIILTMEFGGKRYRKYRIKLLDRNPHCFYCGTPITESNSTLDHVIPECRGGLSSPGNLQLCCPDCNGSKGDATPVEWLADLQAKIAKFTKLADLLAERIESKSLADFQAPQERSTGKKGKGGRPSGGPEQHPEWYITRDKFTDGKTQFSIINQGTGRTLIRGLKLQDAVHYFRAVGGDGEIGLIAVTPLFQKELGLKPRPFVDWEGGEGE